MSSYIYGSSGGYYVYRIDGSRIYNSSGNCVYRIDGNYIYRSGGGYYAYRIDGNYIYDGNGRYVYRVDENYIYRSGGGSYVYKISGSETTSRSSSSSGGGSKSLKMSVPSPSVSSSSDASGSGCLIAIILTVCIIIGVMILGDLIPLLYDWPIVAFFLVAAFISGIVGWYASENETEFKIAYGVMCVSNFVLDMVIWIMLLSQEDRSTFVKIIVIPVGIPAMVVETLVMSLPSLAVCGCLKAICKNETRKQLITAYAIITGVGFVLWLTIGHGFHQCLEIIDKWNDTAFNII